MSFQEKTKQLFLFNIIKKALKHLKNKLNKTKKSGGKNLIISILKNMLSETIFH
jgi:hypothetical protein